LVFVGRLGSLANGMVRIELATGKVEVYQEPSSDRERMNNAQIVDEGSVLIRRAVPPATPQDPNVATLYLRDLRTGRERQIFQVRGATMGFWRSPDGAYVFVVDHRGKPGEVRQRLPFLIALDGDATPLPVPGGPLPEGEGAFVWEASGEAALMLNPTDKPGTFDLVRIPLDGSARTSTRVVVPHADATGPRITAAGDRLAYVIGEPAHELWVLEGLAGTRAATSPPR
jgi:hypothetical protein